MKRITAVWLAVMLAAALTLSGCGGQAIFGVSTQTEKSISVVATRAAKGSAGIGTLTVGENEQVVIDAQNFSKDGKLLCRFALGEFAADAFPEDAAEVTVSGGDSASLTLDPGFYTVAVSTLTGKVTGAVNIYTVPTE